MECYWRILWVTVFCCFTQQTLARGQRFHRSDHSVGRSKREASSTATSASHTAKFLARGASLPSLNSEITQEMARTFSSSSSLQKYLSTKGKSSQHSYKKPKPKFRPIYSNRRKFVSPNPKIGETKTKNSTRNYADLTKKLMKSLLGDKPNKPNVYSEVYSFFSGQGPGASTNTVLRRTDLDDFPEGVPDETGLVPVPEAESRTGLIMAGTVGLMQAFFVVSTSIGFGAFILMALGLLLTIVVKALLAIMLTIYLL